jgi:predicted nucleic acid-binding protein
VVQVTPAVIHAWLDLHQTRSVALHDALIMASAQLVGCSVLLSNARTLTVLIVQVLKCG